MSSISDNIKTLTKNIQNIETKFNKALNDGGIETNSTDNMVDNFSKIKDILRKPISDNYGLTMREGNIHIFNEDGNSLLIIYCISIDESVGYLYATTENSNILHVFDLNGVKLKQYILPNTTTGNNINIMSYNGYVIYKSETVLNIVNINKLDGDETTTEFTVDTLLYSESTSVNKTFTIHKDSMSIYYILNGNITYTRFNTTTHKWDLSGTVPLTDSAVVPDVILSGESLDIIYTYTQSTKTIQKYNFSSGVTNAVTLDTEIYLELEIDETLCGGITTNTLGEIYLYNATDDTFVKYSSDLEKLWSVENPVNAKFVNITIQNDSNLLCSTNGYVCEVSMSGKITSITRIPEVSSYNPNSIIIISDSTNNIYVLDGHCTVYTYTYNRGVFINKTNDSEHTVYKVDEYGDSIMKTEWEKGLNGKTIIDCEFVTTEYGAELICYATNTGYVLTTQDGDIICENNIGSINAIDKSINGRMFIGYTSGGVEEIDMVTGEVTMDYNTSYIVAPTNGSHIDSINDLSTIFNDDGSVSQIIVSLKPMAGSGTHNYIATINSSGNEICSILCHSNMAKQMAYVPLLNAVFFLHSSYSATWNPYYYYNITNNTYNSSANQNIISLAVNSEGWLYYTRSNGRFTCLYWTGGLHTYWTMTTGFGNHAYNVIIDKNDDTYVFHDAYISKIDIYNKTIIWTKGYRQDAPIYTENGTREQKLLLYKDNSFYHIIDNVIRKTTFKNIKRASLC